MFWLPLASTIAGAALGKAKYDRQKALENQTRAQRASEQQYSWATGNRPTTQIAYAGSPVGEMAGGALSGFGTGMSMGQSLKDFDWFGDQANAYTPATGGSVYDKMLYKLNPETPSDADYLNPYSGMRRNV